MSDELENNEQQNNDDISSHEYDGIKELTNKAPAWIILIFIATIAFSGIYAIRYFGHPNNGMSQDEEYARKSAEFDAKLKATQPETQDVANISIEDIIASGAKLYAEKGCLACHGMNGEGNAIGPNLTDNFWLNGCSNDDIIKMITEGKPEKGMTPYSAMMSKTQIKELATYIKKSLVGSNPENGKDPQGEECTDSYGMSQTKEHAKKSGEFDAKLKATQPETQDVENMSVEDIIASGAKLYSEKGCLACHGMNGEGNTIGPNLTDNFWLNGCSNDDIIKMITEGKPEKGMTPYSAMMSKAQIKDLATYIKKSLVGSNPENGKDPQGEECLDS